MNADRDCAGSDDEAGRSASFSEVEGLLVVRDRTLFRPGFEGFCRRLAESAVGLGGVRSAFVCLASGTCRLEFEGGRFTPSEMAEWFAEAVRVAVGRGQDGEAGALEPGGWISLRIASADEGGATWETTLEGRGRFRLRNPAFEGRRTLAGRVAGELALEPGVESCRVTFWRGEIQVRFDREEVCPSEALAAADVSGRRALVAEVLEPARPPELAKGLRRVGYLALAGGSFGLTVVALAVPGVPTLPFLLATSYCLVRSSPALNDRLLRSTFFGPILTDLEFGHGLHWINKLKLMGLTLAIGLSTLIVLTPAWPIVLMMLAFTSASLYAIVRIPELGEIGGGLEPRRLVEGSPGSRIALVS